MSMFDNPGTRRHFLHSSARLASVAGLPLLARPAWASAPGPRKLAMVHTHTGEDIDIVFARGASFVPEALGSLNHFLRDHYSGEVGRIDTGLFDLLHQVRQTLGSNQAFEVISGFRCEATNARLRSQGGGGVARRSLHMQGQAIDVRLPGTSLADLRDAALALAAGGVGYYARSQFVHLDTGRVRHW